MGSCQTTEIKTKNLGTMELDIEADLREFDEENSSRRIDDGSEATSILFASMT
jgi:hypothetical protein